MAPGVVCTWRLRVEEEEEDERSANSDEVEAAWVVRSLATYISLAMCYRATRHVNYVIAGIEEPHICLGPLFLHGIRATVLVRQLVLGGVGPRGHGLVHHHLHCPL